MTNSNQQTNDLICLSHLRWGFVYQRPQHLMSRFARHRRVFFVEEPIWDAPEPRMEMQVCPDSGVRVMIPHIPSGLTDTAREAILQQLLSEMVREHAIEQYITWYYTPMAVGFSRQLQPAAVIYDCMDELSGFKNAPQELKDRERDLFSMADAVFTGGHTLYEAKRQQHHNVHPFPSSVDVPHFAQGRQELPEPEDQKNIPHPRIGFAGVIDERMNLELVGAMAKARPEWHFVMIGPVVKIDPATLPKHPNIHYLGGKNYKDLPLYLSGWDVAILPFAHNESTKFISPTKTPEYLAAGCPVVSTSIRDVVRPYGELKLAHIADTPEEFVAAIERALHDREDPEWLGRVDQMLSTISWDRTWQQMTARIEEALSRKQASSRTSAEAEPAGAPANH